MASDLPSLDVFLEVIEFLHRLCLDLITYVDVGLHRLLITMACPFHDHLR